MANEDLDGYQAFLMNVAGVSPAEMEEEMYRMRGVRLAEHGFLPFDEALSVYAPLKPEDLSPKELPLLTEIPQDDQEQAVVPLTPLDYAGRESMLAEAVSRITDPLLLDRIRLEFAGLCNQILSAEGLPTPELEALIRTCRKAAGYLNLAIERLCGRDISLAEQVLGKHSLVSVFRVGFGLALKLKWEAERWLKESWFHNTGLGLAFWGEPWERTLAGLLEKRPRLYVGFGQEEAYKDFEWLSELGECLEVLRRVMVLDSLLEKLTSLYPPDERWMASPELTFHPFLFSLWARRLLKLEPGFSAVSPEQAKAFLRLLRSTEEAPPYRMDGYEGLFLDHFMSYASSPDPEASSVLREALSLIWHEFREEYEWMSAEDLRERYARFLFITPLPEADGG